LSLETEQYPACVLVSILETAEVLKPFLCGEASALCCLTEESRFAMFGIDVLGGEKSEADG